MSSVLITAATRWEAGPLAKALGLPASGDGRWEGLACGRRVVLLKTGMGAAKTRDLLERDCAAGDYGLVLSAGLCGAMQPGVKTGDIVADAQDVEFDSVTTLKETAEALGLPFHFGKILHTNLVLKPEMKRKLGTENRVLACDMETAAVRRWSGGRAPVIGLRVVLDEIDEAVPPDAPESEHPGALARYALSHVAELPLLVRTGLRSARAMKRLSIFIRAYLETT
ncbi:MAG: hypothetical protein A2V88_03885 [Elusimicrobia bacterium RBG_16_66_12]|nr:MAG: hypothetical protein A2V88_03885 [Elusimicrobia bacterium RBG_16_66_12]